MFFVALYATYVRYNENRFYCDWNMEEDYKSRCNLIKDYEDAIATAMVAYWDALEFMCHYLNSLDELGGLGIEDANFIVEEIDSKPRIALRYQELLKRKDFPSEEEWFEYQCQIIGLCCDRVENKFPDLEIFCMPYENEP